MVAYLDSNGQLRGRVVAYASVVRRRSRRTYPRIGDIPTSERVYFLEDVNSRYARMSSSQITGDRYEIVIGKRLGSRSAKGFEGFELIEIPDDGMFLRGVVADQAGLHGVLAQIRDLGIPLLGVRRITSEDVPAGTDRLVGRDPAPGAEASGEAE